MVLPMVKDLNLTINQANSKLDKLVAKDNRVRDYIKKYGLFQEPDEVSEEAWRRVIRRDMEEFYG